MIHLTQEFVDWTQKDDGPDISVHGHKSSLSPKPTEDEMKTAFENMVKANAKKLDEIVGLYSKYNGKYIGYNGSDIFIADTFTEAIEQAESKFGEKTPFVIRKIGHEVILSNFVKI